MHLILVDRPRESAKLGSGERQPAWNPSGDPITPIETERPIVARLRQSDRRARARPPEPVALRPKPIPPWLEWLVEHGLWVTVAAAALARLIYWMHIYASNPLYAHTLPKCDMDTYWQWGRKIAAGDWLSRQSQPGPFYYGPLYPYFLAAIFRLFGESFHAVHGIQALVGLLPPALLWAIGRQLFGKGPALATGLLAALCAPFLFYEQTLLMEGLLIAIHATILWCLVRGQEASGQRAWRWALGAGMLSGLACWGRGNFTVVIPVLAAAWLVVPVLIVPGAPSASKAASSKAPSQRPKSLWRSGAFCAAAYTLGAALLLAVTLWRNHYVSGGWVLTTNNGPTLLYVGNASDSRGIYFFPPSFQALEDQYKRQGAVPWGREVLRDVAAHPAAFVRLLVKKTWMFWNSYDYADNISYYLCKRFSPLLQWSPSTWLTIVPLAVLGIWETRRSWRRQMFLYVYAAAFALSIIAVFIVGRYRLEELLPLLVWAGAALAVLARRAWEKQWKNVGARAAVVAGGIALLWPAWSPAVAYNTPSQMKGIHLVRPNDYNQIALAWLEVKQREPARKLLEEAVVQYPYLEGIAFPLSALYIEDGNPQRAVAILQGYVRIRGTEKYGLLRLANALSLCGRKAEAISAVQNVMRNHPGDAEAAAILSLIQSRP